MITIPNDFATLESYDRNTGIIRYRFNYGIDVEQAFRSNAHKVKVSVYSNSLPELPITPNQFSTISDHLAYHSEVKNYSNKAAGMLVASGVDDLTAYVDNSSVSTGGNQLLSTRKKIVVVSNDKVTSTEGQQILSASLSAPSVSLASTQLISLDLINKFGIDPSEVTIAQSYEVPKLLELSNQLNASDLKGYAYTQIVQVDSSNFLESYVLIDVSLSDLRSGKSTIVVYELIDDSGIPISTNKQDLSYNSHISAWSMPTLPPIANFASNTTNKFSTLNLKQVDEKADKVVIYYKEMNGTKYSLYSELDLKFGQQESIKVLTPEHHPIIYRLIPKNSDLNLLSHEFKNVVLSPRCYKDSEAVSLTASSSDSGIEIEVSNLPATAIAVTLVRKNVTLREVTWTRVNSAVNPTAVGPGSGTQGAIVYNDNDLISGHCYEYAAEVQYSTGVSKRCGTELVEYVPKTAGVARLSINNFTVENVGTGDLNVKFDISLSLEDTDESIVLSLLESAGLAGYYETEITNVKANLNKLLSCRVQRINMTTGVREDFGIMNSDSLNFSESDLRGDKILPPIRGTTYRYVVSVMARDPETLFTKTKDATSTSGRAYKFSPRKFRHPAILKSGTLFSNNGLKKLLAKSELEFGEIGLFAYRDLNLTEVTPSLTNLMLQQFDRNTNKISWTFNGNANLIDHFLVIKRSMGIQRFVGKVHNVSSDGNYFYYDNFAELESGVFDYIVIPIYSNYEAGDPVLTNPLLVGEA